MQGPQRVHEKTTRVREHMGKVIVGQDVPLEQLLTCFLADGHVILEGVPGWVKRFWPGPWLDLWMRNFAGSSSPLTCFPATSWEPTSLM